MDSTILGCGVDSEHVVQQLSGFSAAQKSYGGSHDHCASCCRGSPLRVAEEPFFLPQAFAWPWLQGEASTRSRAGMSSHRAWRRSWQRCRASAWLAACHLTAQASSLPPRERGRRQCALMLHPLKLANRSIALGMRKFRRYI